MIRETLRADIALALHRLSSDDLQRATTFWEARNHAAYAAASAYAQGCLLAVLERKRDSEFVKQALEQLRTANEEAAEAADLALLDWLQRWPAGARGIRDPGPHP